MPALSFIATPGIDAFSSQPSAVGDCISPTTKPAKRKREDANQDYISRFDATPTTTARPHKRVRFNDASEVDAQGDVAAPFHPMNNLPAVTPINLPPVQLMTADAWGAQPAEAASTTADKGTTSAEVLLAVERARLATADLHAEETEAKAARAALLQRDALDACTMYNDAIERQQIDLSTEKAAADRARIDLAKAKEMFGDVVMTPEKARDIHYEIHVRRPAGANDPKYCPWMWIATREKVVRREAEARAWCRKAAEELRVANNRVEASEQCLHKIIELRAAASQELSEATRAANHLEAAAASAREEVVQLASRFRDMENAVQAAAAAAEAVAAAAEAAAAVKQQQAAAAAAAAMQGGRRKSTSRRRGAVTSREYIKASKLKTLWAVADVFDECTAPSNCFPQDEYYSGLEKGGRSERYSSRKEASFSRTSFF